MFHRHLKIQFLYITENKRSSTLAALTVPLFSLPQSFVEFVLGYNIPCRTLSTEVLKIAVWNVSIQVINLQCFSTMCFIKVRDFGKTCFFNPSCVELLKKLVVNCFIRSNDFQEFLLIGCRNTFMLYEILRWNWNPFMHIITKNLLTKTN